MTEEATKDVEQQLEHSIQRRARDDRDRSMGINLLTFLAQTGGLLPPWWSKRRDLALSKFWMSCPHLSGAYYTLSAKLGAVPFRIEPRDPSVARHRKLAEDYQDILEEQSEFGGGWQELIVPGLIDFYTQDNGWFMEVIGDGNKDGPIVGPALGLAHLDSWRCQRSSSLEYPVIYQDIDGKRYKLHRTRVIYRSQMPSPRAEMYKVGFCWTSRIADVAQNLIDIATYKQEKLGSRPQRGIMVTQGGLDPEDVESAFVAAQIAMDNQSLSRFSKFVVMGGREMEDADLIMKDLASLPDGFDEQQSITLGMFAIALTGGVPPRWLWPASVTGATKADALYQHVAGLTGGPGATLKMIANALGGSERGKQHTSGKFLPPSLKMVFDFQDDEQDRMQAEVKKTRSEQRERDLNDGVITTRVAREQARQSGDISEAQFEEMELDENRLPDGSPILMLFHSRDGQMQGLLAVDAEGEPLRNDINDSALWLAAIDKQILLDEAITVNAPNAAIKRKARQAVAALKALRILYGGSELELPEPPEPPEPDEEEPEEETQDMGDDQEEAKSEGPFEVKGKAADMRRSIRGAVRGLWTGHIDFNQFVTSMGFAIERGLTFAWQEGAAEVGIGPGEMSDAERNMLQQRIANQMQHVVGFGQAILAGSKAEGGKLGPLHKRAEMWSGQYQSAVNQGRIMAGGDRKYRWTLGDAEHCTSCLKLNGKVKRGSFWQRSGILPGIPGSSYLACGGYRCPCRLALTDEPISRGPLPGLP